MIEPGGPSGRGRYYRLTSPAYELLGQALAYHVDSRLSRENVKGRILTALQKGALSNADIREITQLDRRQALWIMQQLQKEGLVNPVGSRRGSRWQLAQPVKPAAKL